MFKPFKAFENKFQGIFRESELFIETETMQNWKEPDSQESIKVEKEKEKLKLEQEVELGSTGLSPENPEVVDLFEESEESNPAINIPTETRAVLVVNPKLEPQVHLDENLNVTPTAKVETKDEVEVLENSEEVKVIEPKPILKAEKSPERLKMERPPEMITLDEEEEPGKMRETKEDEQEVMEVEKEQIPEMTVTDQEEKKPDIIVDKGEIVIPSKRIKLDVEVVHQSKPKAKEHEKTPEKRVSFDLPPLKQEDKQEPENMEIEAELKHPEEKAEEVTEKEIEKEGARVTESMATAAKMKSPPKETLQETENSPKETEMEENKIPERQRKRKGNPRKRVRPTENSEELVQIPRKVKAKPREKKAKETPPPSSGRNLRKRSELHPPTPIYSAEPIRRKVSTRRHSSSTSPNSSSRHLKQTLPASQGQALSLKKLPQASSSCFKNSTFVISGHLPSFPRQEVANYIVQHGGRVTKEVSSKTNYVIVGHDPGETNLKRAKEHNTHIISEDELVELIRSSNEVAAKPQAA